MRKLILSFVMILGFATFMQAQTEKGAKFIEINTGFGPGPVGNTGFALESGDDNTNWNVGLEGGTFLIDNLALKTGLGYGSQFEIGVLSYKIGAKYYLAGVAPLEFSYSGSSIKDAEEDPSYLGFQGGYAIFLGDSGVAIEPGLRYNLSLNDEFYESLFQGNIGFALFFD